MEIPTSLLVGVAIASVLFRAAMGKPPAADAVDPSATDPGKLSTRDKGL